MFSSFYKTTEDGGYSLLTETTVRQVDAETFEIVSEPGAEPMLVPVGYLIPAHALMADSAHREKVVAYAKMVEAANIPRGRRPPQRHEQYR